MAYRRTREVKARFDLTVATEQETAPFEIIAYPLGSIQATWSSVSAFDGDLRIQGSVDGEGWNDVVGDNDYGIAPVDNAADTQIWEIVELSFKFIRVKYTPGTNATGEMEIVMFGSER